MSKLKTNEEILATLKKANREYRQRLAERAGFLTVDMYIAHLKQSPNTLPKKGGKAKVVASTAKPVIHNVYILDASGSMSGGKFTNALLGINKEVELLKKGDEVEYTQSIIDFSDNNDIRTVFFKVPIKNMTSYHSGTRGSTALYQAMGQTIERLLSENKNGEKVLVKVFTDGGENDSKGLYNSYTGAAPLTNLIKRAEDAGFTITFVGTAQDVRAMQKNLSIHESNTLVHDNTERGVAQTFCLSTEATVLYSQSVVKGEDVKRGFYKKLGKL